jgi:hypothetical protein
MVELFSDRPGFHVTFELRPEEDRQASIDAGHPVFKDVEYAVITMPGGSLVVDKQITPALLREWREGSENQRKAPAPFAVRAYEAWKDGLEPPVNGTPLIHWPGVTPAQLKMCAAINIRSIEDLAEANEDAIRKIGMGGRALKDKAAAYLRSAVTNKSSEEISALMVRVEALEDALRKEREKNAVLEAELGDEEEVPKRGRPRKAA